MSLEGLKSPLNLEFISQMGKELNSLKNIHNQELIQPQITPILNHFINISDSDINDEFESVRNLPISRMKLKLSPKLAIQKANVNKITFMF